MTNTTICILIDKATKKKLKLFAVQNDKSMGKAIQLLLDQEQKISGGYENVVS